MRRAELHPGRALTAAAGVLGELLLTLGALVLLFLLWQLWWTDVTASADHAVTTRTLERQFDTTTPSGAPGTPADGAATNRAPTSPPHHPARGTPFAVLRVPRFGAGYAQPVLEGTDHDTLTKGVGHYRHTALPGQIGNLALAGHRTTYGHPFAAIDTLRPGDSVVLETADRTFTYRVTGHTIVTPDNIGVLDPVPEHPRQTPHLARLTMTSCHPKYTAAQRYVTYAVLEKATPRANSLPPAPAQQQERT